MRFLLSLFLTVTVYVAIAAFFYNYLFPKPKQEKKVYIHTAIIAKKQTLTAKIKKSKPVKKSGSKTNVTHGGKKIKFNDIFKNVEYNVDTKKIVPKAQLDMSRFRGVERNLKKIKKLGVKVNFVQVGDKKIKDKDINDFIAKKLYKIWYEVSTMPDDYAKINIVSKNGVIDAYIIDSNLNPEKQEFLVNEIKKLTYGKNFDITVIFQSKVSDD